MYGFKLQNSRSLQQGYLSGIKEKRNTKRYKYILHIHKKYAQRQTGTCRTAAVVWGSHNER